MQLGFQIKIEQGLEIVLIFVKILKFFFTPFRAFISSYWELFVDVVSIINNNRTRGKVISSIFIFKHNTYSFPVI